MARVQRKPLNPAVRAEVMARDGHTCQTCGATDNLSIDHRIALVNGGTDDIENLWVMCHPCNLRKGKSDRPLYLQPRDVEADNRMREAVARARLAREVAEAKYLATLVEAVAAGLSYAELAKVAGISRQAVRQHVERVTRAA